MRAALGAVCCGQAAARAAPGTPDDLQELLARAWALHELLLRRLALQDRALRLPIEPPAIAVGAGGRTWQAVRQGLNRFLAHFHSTAVALLSGGADGSTCSGGSGEDAASAGGAAASAARATACDASMADWFDGRLLHCLVLALWQGRLPDSLGCCEHAEVLELLLQAGSAAAAAGYTAGRSWTLPAPTGQAGGASQARLEAGGSAGGPAGPPMLAVVRGNAPVEAVVGSVGGGSLLLGAEPEVAAPVTVMGTTGAPHNASYHWHTGEPGAAWQAACCTSE